MTDIKRRGRGLGKKPPMKHITIRMPQHVVDHYDGNLKAMRDAWVTYVESLPYPSKESGVDKV